jgi:hypothetical protein
MAPATCRRGWLRNVPLCIEPVPADLLSWAVAKPNIGHLNPPFLQPYDVVYHGGDTWVLEMFLDASRLDKMANLPGDVTSFWPVSFKKVLDPALWDGVVPFKFLSSNSRMAMAHYEFLKANCKRLHGIDMGEAQVRVVLTICRTAFTKALLLHRVIIDCAADGVMFRMPITPEFYDAFMVQEAQLTVNTLVSNGLPEVAESECQC